MTKKRIFTICEAARGPQVAFLDAVKAQGGVAFIATGIDDIERELEGLIWHRLNS